MSVNLVPNIRTPVLIKPVWIFDKENFVGANLEIVALFRPDWNRITLTVQRKDGQHLLVLRSPRRNIRHHILNRKLLQRQQHSRLMRKIRLPPLPRSEEHTSEL